jgi:hypothetical protein
MLKGEVIYTEDRGKGMTRIGARVGDVVYWWTGHGPAPARGALVEIPAMPRPSRLRPRPRMARPTWWSSQRSSRRSCRRPRPAPPRRRSSACSAPWPSRPQQASTPATARRQWSLCLAAPRSSWLGFAEANLKARKAGLAGRPGKDPAPAARRPP